MYEGLPEDSRPKLKNANVILIAATGDRIEIRGKAMFGMKLGDTIYEHRKQRGTTCFLGLDFLYSTLWGVEFP